jgi:hypothetical protein
MISTSSQRAAESGGMSPVRADTARPISNGSPAASRGSDTLKHFLQEQPRDADITAPRIIVKQSGHDAKWSRRALETRARREDPAA